jgi:excisionase family DNA binding protein
MRKMLNMQDMRRKTVDLPVTEPAYRVREIAVMLSVDDSTVYRWIEKGMLAAYRFEDSIRVAPEDFEAFKKRSLIKSPAVVVSVANDDEARELVAYARSRGWAVSQGSGGLAQPQMRRPAEPGSAVSA